MASKAIGFLNFKFGADLSGFERAMKKAQKNLKKFGKNVTKAGQNLSRNLTLPILALGAASIKVFDIQIKAETRLLTALKGREDIQKRLITQAAELQKITLFADEEIISQQAYLAALGMTEEQINKVIKASMDLAVGTGQTLEFGVKNLAKTFGGLTGELGESLPMLKELTKEELMAGKAVDMVAEAFKGQAVAAREADTGLTVLYMLLGDLGEQIGSRLLPYVQKFTDYLKTLISRFDDLTEEQKDNVVKWGLILAAIGPALIIIGKVATGISALIPIFITLGGVITGTIIPAFGALWAIMLANPFGAMLAALGLLAAGITALVSSNNEARESQKNLNKELEETGRVERSLAFMRNDKAKQEIYIAERRLMFKEKLANANTKEEKQLARAQIQLSDLRDNVAYWGKALENTLDQVGYDLSLEFYKEAQKAVEDQIDVVGKLQKLVVKQNKVINKGTEEIKMYSEAVEILSTEFLFMQSKAEDQFKNMIFWTKELTLAQKLNNAGWLMFGDIVTTSLDSALDSQENFFSLFMKNIKKAIRSLLIQLAVMTVIQSLMGVPAAFTTANLSKNLSTLMGVTGFAEGGLVTGPTTALIGEGIGTTASNPEVVAPLDKLKQYMGGGNQNIIVEGVLKGNDIYLSNKNTSINRLRTT